MKKNERNSSFELLRIICMFLIIFHHYSVHAGFMFEGNGINFNEILVKVLSLGGKLACDIFILITGYFLINSKCNYSKIIKLIIKMYVYAIISVILCYGSGILKFDLKNCIKELLPVFYGGWFVVFYILMYLIAPFLNTMLKSLDKEQYKNFIVVLLIIWSFIPTFTKSDWEFSNIDTFIVMYLIGAYLKLHVSEDSISKKKNLIGIIVCSLCIIVSTIVLVVIGQKLDISAFRTSSRHFSNINSIFVVLDAIFIFQYFRTVTFTSLKINFIASSMLGVYLIHDDRLLRSVIWKKLWPNINYMNSNFLFLHAIIKVSLVFLICVIFDKLVTEILERTIYKKVDNKEDNNKEKIKNHV